MARSRPQVPLQPRIGSTTVYWIEVGMKILLLLSLVVILCVSLTAGHTHRHHKKPHPKVYHLLLSTLLTIAAVLELTAMAFIVFDNMC